MQGLNSNRANPILRATTAINGSFSAQNYITNRADFKNVRFNSGSSGLVSQLSS